ncbi:MAG: FixH family protein [Pseudomonadota bacterium]
MSGNPKAKPFTGKHMAVILVVGFGIVAAVNFTMASYATGGFHGVVVDNSYVASQKFNGWLEQAQKARELGWQARAARADDGHVVVTSKGVPNAASVTAELRRPLGTREYASLRFTPTSEGTYRSHIPVDEGRWTIRLSIAADGDSWIGESELR